MNGIHTLVLVNARLIHREDQKENKKGASILVKKAAVVRTTKATHAHKRHAHNLTRTHAAHTMDKARSKTQQGHLWAPRG